MILSYLGFAGIETSRQICFGIDTIHEWLNSDFDVKCANIQFYGNSHNY